jgi:hypothetical protein
VIIPLNLLPFFLFIFKGLNMKGKFLIGLAIATLSLTNAAHADFTFYSEDHHCKHVHGSWSGSGKAHHWLIGTCEYNGSGTISELDSNGHFGLQVKADKQSGSLLCPRHTEHALTGKCVNGEVTVMTEYGNLTGIFSEHSGTSSGTLNVSAGVNVDVEIQFKRAQ